MDIPKLIKAFVSVCFLGAAASNASAQQLCENQYVGSIPYYQGWSSCYGSGYWNGSWQYDWIDEYVGFTFDSFAWIDEFRSYPYPGGWLSCQASVPYAGEYPIYEEVCQHLSSYSYTFDGDTSNGTLYDQENTSILASWNLDDATSFVVGWNNPGSYSVRVEYMIDYRANASPLPDIGWTHLATWSQGSTGGTLPLNQRWDFPNFPDHFDWVSTATHTNYVNKSVWRSAVLSYRYRLESSSQNGDWQYMRPVWLYERD